MHLGRPTPEPVLGSTAFCQVHIPDPSPRAGPLGGSSGWRTVSVYSFLRSNTKQKLKFTWIMIEVLVQALGTIFWKWALGCPKFLTERHGDNYSVVTADSQCCLGFVFWFFWGGLSNEVINGLVQNSTSPRRSLASHFYTILKRPTSANQILTE